MVRGKVKVLSCGVSAVPLCKALLSSCAMGSTDAPGQAGRGGGEGGGAAVPVMLAWLHQRAWLCLGLWLR